MISRFYALVDYFNLIPDRYRNHLNHATHRNAIDTIYSKIIEADTKLGIDYGDISMRLYGGWMRDDGEPTDDYLMISSILRDFPKHISRRRHIIPCCADSILSRTDLVLPATIRESRGFPPFRVDSHPKIHCPAGVARCPVEDLNSWKRGRCPHHPSCATRVDDVIVSTRQKLVDSMMVADQIYLSREAMDAWVAIFSNDDDVVPGLMVAAHYSRQVVLVRIGRRNVCLYDSFLEDVGTKILNL
jgi:hypothetical protein